MTQNNWIIFFLIAVLGVACKSTPEQVTTETIVEETTLTALTNTALVILGTVQDAGAPQIGCQKACCRDLYDEPNPQRKVVSLGLVDAINQQTYLFEATPDISTQVAHLSRYTHAAEFQLPAGIFLTHAHIGHYAGLMYLGKEAMDAHSVPVYAMPRMQTFLTQNGPWSQLVERENIQLEPLAHQESVILSDNIRVTPFQVPHRDEFSETVGYRIQGPYKTALFIPDIDKWSKWETDIVAAIQEVDYAFLDATFYSGAELNNRDMSEIPHPFILESLAAFSALSPEEKQRVVFIHFNHTNPVLDPASEASNTVEAAGFRLARYGEVFEL